MRVTRLPNGLYRVEDRASGLVALFNADKTPRDTNAQTPFFRAAMAEHA